MSQVTKWKKLKSEYLIDDQWIKVRADTCELPSKKIIAPYYVIQYPTWLNIFAVNKDREVVLVRQYRHGIGQVVLELPSGTMDKKDISAEKAARRELIEETGFGGGEFIEVGSFSPNTANHVNKVHCFLAKDVERISEPIDDEYEQIEPVVKPLKEVIKMARNNEFMQAMHMATIFMALDKMGFFDA